MINSNTMLPKTSKNFNSESLDEKVNYLLSHPVVYTLNIGEINRLKNLRDSPPINKNSDEYALGQGFTIDCFKNLEKIPYIKWIELLNLPEVTFE